MGLLNYTTEVDADKTAAEIAKILSKHGASAVMTEYHPTEEYVTALSFKIRMGDKEASFRLPIDWKPVYAILTNGKSWKQSYDDKYKRKMESTWRLQAVRTSWRIVKDWVEAQCALIETQMVTTGQVFLPYLIMRDGKTLAETVAHNPQFLLGDGK